jgi:hypothetical protein
MNKKQNIIEQFKQGKKLVDIANDLKTYYAYVHGVIKEYKKDQEILSLRNSAK